MDVFHSQDLLYALYLQCDIRSCGQLSSVNRLSSNVFNQQHLWKEKLTMTINTSNYQLDYKRMHQANVFATDFVNVLFILKMMEEYKTLYIVEDSCVVNLFDYDFSWLNLDLSNISYEEYPYLCLDTEKDHFILRMIYGKNDNGIHNVTLNKSQSIDFFFKFVLSLS